MARAALGWSLDKMAKEADLYRLTVHRFERGHDAYASTVEKMRNAFLATGRVRFEGDDCVCVRDADDERATQRSTP